MAYTFDIVGVAPILTAFEYQYQAQEQPHRSKAYLSSPHCTLDDFIKSTELIPAKPEWNWDEVIQRIVNFWLKHEDRVRYWQQELFLAGQQNVVVARVANVETLRHEFESLLGWENWD